MKNGRVKIIRTRHVVEVYQYEHMPSSGCGGRTPTPSEHWKDNRKKSGKQQRDKFRRLITANFDSGSKFVTLTFRDGTVDDVKDVQACHKEWDKFSKRLRRKYPDVKAIAVVEFQDKNGRGAVHYHMISNLPYVPNNELSELWGNGWVRINNIERVDNVGAYVVKYMGKDVDDLRLRGLKAYYRVGKLEEPTVSWQDDTSALAALVDGNQPVYEDSYGDEYHGRILYHQYNLKRDITVDT